MSVHCSLSSGTGFGVPVIHVLNLVIKIHFRQCLLVYKYCIYTYSRTFFLKNIYSILIITLEDAVVTKSLVSDGQEKLDRMSGEGLRLIQSNGYNMPVQAIRKYRKDTSEVSCCLKYVIFGFNVLFWVSNFLFIYNVKYDSY